MKLLKALNNYYLSLGLGLIVLLLLQPFLEIVVVLGFFLVLYSLIRNKKEFFFIFVIISFLVLTTTISPTLRGTVQVLDYLFLSFVFVKQYQFQIYGYPRPHYLIVAYLLSLLIVMMISSLNSAHVLLGFIQVGRTILFFFLMYLLYALINDEKEIKIYLIALFIVAVVYMFFLIYELMRFDFNLLAINLNGFSEGGSAYIHKNALGSFFVIVILLSMSFSFNPDYSYYKKWFLGLIILFSGGLIITNARGAIIALLVGMSYLIYIMNKKYFKYMIGLLLCFWILFVFLPLQEYVDLYFRFETFSTGRDYILSSIWTVIKENWILGAGPAGTRFEMYKNIPYLLGSPEEIFLRHHYYQIEFGHAHNFYLFFFSDLGILGFLLSITLPVIFLKISFKTIYTLKNEKKEFYYLSVGITAYGLSMFVRAIYEWSGLISYGTIGLDLPFWILFVIIIFINQKVISSNKKDVVISNKS